MKTFLRLVYILLLWQFSDSNGLDLKAETFKELRAETFRELKAETFRELKAETFGSEVFFIIQMCALNLSSLSTTIN